nr:transposon protein, putative, Mutator sub-class [Tanacetum cinerariifolium]
MWNPTEWHFTLYDSYPLTRILEPTVEPIKLSPSVSSSTKIPMLSKFVAVTLGMESWSQGHTVADSYAETLKEPEYITMNLMDNEKKGYETCEEEEGYGKEDEFSSSEEYDLEDDCEAELDEITETLDPHRDIEVAVGIEAVIEHYRTTKQKRRMPPIKNPEKVLKQHGDGEENNHHDGKETYRDNSDVDSLDEEIIEDGTIELRRTLVRFPRYDEKCKIVTFSIGQSFTDHKQFKRALLKYAVQEKRDYIFKKNARYRVRVKCIDEHCEWMVYAANEVHDSKKYFLVKTLNKRHTCSKVFQISHVKSPWIAEQYEAMIYAHPGIKPTYILDTIKAQVEIEVTRNQCKRAKLLVMRRLERDVINEYKKLNDYAKALVDTNPGTSVDIAIEHIGTGIPFYFKRMYVCLAAVREGFLDGCRKYLGLDGCFLKGVVKGMLLTAVEHLKVDIRTKDGGEWTFMSDKQKDFRGEQMKLAIYSIAKCANEAQLRQRLDEIDNIKTGAKQSLKNKDNNQWCRVFFKSGTKCDCVDNNSTEAWNFVLIFSQSCKWKIKWNGADEFQVYYGRTQHCVHIGDKTCSCGAWQLSGILCCHATAAIRSRSKNPFDYLDQCYSKEKFIAAYNHPIKVVGSEEFWPNSDRGELSPRLPKPMPGRLKKARRRRKYEPKKSKTKLSHHGRDMHCGNCNSNTYNSKTVHPPRMMQVHQELEPTASVRNDQSQMLESASAPRHGN